MAGANTLIASPNFGGWLGEVLRGWTPTAEEVRKRTVLRDDEVHGRAARGSVVEGGLRDQIQCWGPGAEWPANSVLQIIRCSWGMPHVVMTTVQPRRESRGAPPQLPESWVTWGSLALRHAALAFEGRRSLCIGPRLCCGRDSFNGRAAPHAVTSERAGVGSCFWRVVPPSALAQM